MTRSRPDLRAVALAGFAWGGGLAGFLLPPWLTAALGALGAASLAVRLRRGRAVAVAAAWFVAATAVAGGAIVRSEATARSPVADLAAEHAFVSAEVRVTSDPILREGERERFTLTRATVVSVTGRGRTTRTRVPVLVIAGEQWNDVELGSRVLLQGRSAPADGPDLAAVISTGRRPRVLEPPAQVLDAAAEVRAGIRDAVAGSGSPERVLVPALVVGDDRGMPVEVTDDFRTTGLTHLLAVSGTNLTLVVGFVLVLARWLGVQARGLVIVGILGVVGFVLLARTEPSVVRAAAMGSVALIGMGANGREAGVRALGVAVLVLLLLDPWLVLSLGFALSALATAGILFFAPVWRDALARWLPRWVAEAVAVPLAAQLACTPLVAAISGQVSLVAVVTNLAVAPAVGPATVLGLAGGLVHLLLEPAGALLGRVAGGCAWWIVTVAERGADLPTAAVAWSPSWPAVAGLTLVSVVVALLLPGLLVRRAWSLVVAVLVLLVVVRPLPTPGWPPEGWVMVACDVGQGDALVLNAGGGDAVVVDVGPDPVAVDRCLDRLGVRRLPVVVLTHFHEDHVAGLPGALDGRPVEEVVVTGLAEPAGGAAAVARWTREAGVTARVPAYGEVRRLRDLTWQVVGPPPGAVDASGGATGEEGSAPNNASVALLVEVRGVRLLLTGDMEPEAQEAMASVLPDLRVDVLKVPHHGSRHQDASFLRGLGSRLAVISVGENNGYGHPARETVELLEGAGATVRRTDLGGDIAVVSREGGLSVEEFGARRAVR